MSPERNSNGSPTVSKKKGKKRLREQAKAKPKKVAKSTNDSKPEKRRKRAKKIQELELDEVTDGDVLVDELNSGLDDEELEITDDPAAKTPFQFSNELFEVPEFPDKSAGPSLMRPFVEGISYRKLSSNSLIVSILHGARLYFIGRAVVTVLKGVVDILGHEMGEKDLRRTVFSPKGHSSLLSIQGVSGEFCPDSISTRDSFSEPDFLEVDERPFERIISIEELEALGGAVIVLEGFENEWCGGIRRYCLDGLALVGSTMSGFGPGVTPKPKGIMKKVGFQFVSPDEEETRRLFEPSDEWTDLGLDSLLREPVSSEGAPKRLVVFGGKGVGKSTFTRWLLNKSLKWTRTVLYIDLDPGQPEFTPPGLVSVVECREPLLGSNFTHLQQPFMSVFVGSINVADQPLTYLNAMKQIWRCIQEHPVLRKLPCLVNTMGFTQGLGVDFACETVKLFQPTEVIQIHINNERRCFPFVLSKEGVESYDGTLNHLQRGEETLEAPIGLQAYRTFEIESVCNIAEDRNENQWGISARELRENLLVSYFAGIIGSRDILSIGPHSLSLTKMAVGTVNSKLSWLEALKALNGNLVALCTCPPEYITASKAGEVMIDNKTGLGVPNIYHGYGLVRAIDLEASLIFVLSPVSAERLKTNVNSLICAGSIGMPLQFYLSSAAPDADEADREIPYVMTTSKTNSKLHSSTKRQFVPKRVAHTVLNKCVM